MRTGWIAVLVLLTTSAIAQLRERLDSVLLAHTRSDQPGIALWVEIGGKLVYRNGYGIVNELTRGPITPATNFRMASVTKQFTAMGILLLEKAGKLSVDDSLSRFFPEFNQAVGQRVRLRHLLTHSSGLVDYESIMNPDQQTQLSDADVLSLLKDRDSLYFEPGSQFRYSNSGFCLLALVIERISGQSFASFIRQHIFLPLKMTQSVVYEAGMLIPNRAMGYARAKDGTLQFSDQSLTSATKGDGGVYTSLADYKKWSEALRTNALLDLKAALSRIKQPLPHLPDQYYGLGWFFRQPAKPILFHSGSTCGFSTFVINQPDQRLQIVYFSNVADNTEPFKAIMQVLNQAGGPSLKDVMALHALTQ